MSLLTPEEEVIHSNLGRIAGMIFALPKLHPSDDREVETMIHSLQNWLMARPQLRSQREDSPEWAARLDQ